MEETKLKTAILLLAYKRWDILNKVIDALNKNKHYDLVVIFDNHNEINEYQKMKEKILSYFPNAIIKMREQHLGLDLNVICSLHEMFYTYNFDRVFYIEDDIYTDPTCLETLENLMNWTDKNLPNIGIVQSWNNNLANEQYIKLHALQDLDYSKTCTYAQNEIGYTGQNFWGALISKKCWDIINPFIWNHFDSLAKNKSFNFDNYVDLVCKLIKSKANDNVKVRIVNRFYWESWESSVDLAMIANNFFKIALTNPRSKSIGNEGTSWSNDLFTSINLDKIQTLNSPNVPTQFVLNQQSKKLWLKE